MRGFPFILVVLLREPGGVERVRTDLHCQHNGKSLSVEHWGETHPRARPCARDAASTPGQAKSRGDRDSLPAYEESVYAVVVEAVSCASEAPTGSSRCRMTPTGSSMTSRCSGRFPGASALKVRLPLPSLVSCADFPLSTWGSAPGLDAAPPPASKCRRGASGCLNSDNRLSLFGQGTGVRYGRSA